MTTPSTLRYRQPIVFGPSPGPRQNSQGETYKPTLKGCTKTQTTMRFKTKASAIRALFPNERYSLPDTDDKDDFAYATWSLESLRNLSWLSGSGYDLLALYVEDVIYTDTHGRRRHCTYNPIMIENFADPIMTGREELGVPKLFSDIDITVDETENSSSSDLNATVSWRGATWMEIRVPFLRQQQQHPSVDTNAETDTTTKTTPPQSEGLLVHKYIPSSGGGVNSKPDADYDVLIRNDPAAATIKTTRVADPSDTKISIHNLGSQKLPTLCNVVDGLSRIPILEIVDARMVDIQGMSDLSNLERLN